MRRVLVLAAFLAACGGPLLFVPGGRLRGEVVEEPVTDWSFVTDDYRLDPRQP